MASVGELTADEYDVYSAYLSGMFADMQGKQLVGKPFKVVILNMTKIGDDEVLGENGQPAPWETTADSLRKKFPILQQATLDAFRRANSRQAVIHSVIHGPIGYELVDPGQVQVLFEENGGGWPAYYKQHPGSQGILSFSRVGFSSDRRQAFFYMSSSCGDLCGAGIYVVMQRQGEGWIIGKEFTMWVS